MMKYPVITISRQYGSGGRFVGRLLAEKLNIPFYDNELINLAAKKSGYAKDLFENAEQQPTSSLMYSLSMFGNVGTAYHMPLADKIFIIQSEVIKEVAAQGPCVIVGRCSDYVLRDHPDCVNIFIHSNINDRIKRVVEYYGVPKAKANDVIIKTDRKRAAYYSYYTDNKWGLTENYHLSINSDAIGVENAVDVIISFINAHIAKKESENKTNEPSV